MSSVIQTMHTMNNALMKTARGSVDDMAGAFKNFDGAQDALRKAVASGDQQAMMNAFTRTQRAQQGIELMMAVKNMISNIKPLKFFYFFV